MKLLTTATLWVVVLKKSYCKIKSLLVIQENSYQLQGKEKILQGKERDGGRVVSIFLIMYDQNI